MGDMPEDLDLGYSPAFLAATDFIKEVALGAAESSPDKVSEEVGLVPIANGVIIENLAAGQPIEQATRMGHGNVGAREVWSLMYMVRDILDLHGVGGQGVRQTGVPGKGA